MILMPQIFDVTANENARYKRNELESLFYHHKYEFQYCKPYLICGVLILRILYKVLIHCVYIRDIHVPDFMYQNACNRPPWGPTGLRWE